MPFTTAFRDQMASTIASSLYANGNAHIGVGNSTTAFATSQTDLVGASKARKAMDASYPTVAANVVTFRSTLASGDANFTWDEFGVFSASTGGTMMVRKVQALGTKTSAETKQLTITVSLAV